MIFDSYEAFRAANFAAKVCILGSGPAGTTIARKLGAAGIPVVVLEAGSREFSDDSQDFYRGVTVGDPYFDLDITRLRFMGGSSNHWAGWCRVLDSQDFEPKAWAPDTGWPISRAEIEPYLPEVQDILELPDFRPDMPISDDIRWVQLIKSPAVRFGEKFADELDRSRNVAVVLSTYATELTGDGRRVTGAKLWSNGQNAGSFAADYFIVCTGGLENSRLLLWSNQRSNGGVVPKATALGRYWMEHPTFEGGNAILADYSELEVDATNEAFFSPTPAAMERLEIMNFGIRLIEMPYPGHQKRHRRPRLHGARDGGMGILSTQPELALRRPALCRLGTGAAGLEPDPVVEDRCRPCRRAAHRAALEKVGAGAPHAARGPEAVRQDARPEESRPGAHRRLGRQWRGLSDQ